MKKTMIKVARGEEPADLVLKNANVVNMFTEQLELRNVAISNGKIVGISIADFCSSYNKDEDHGEKGHAPVSNGYRGKKEVDLKGKILCPGFMDGHMHFETSLIAPSEYEKAVLPRGTTAVVADPHELANISGTRGIDCILDMAKHLRIHGYIAMPSCVPSCDLEETGYVLEAEDLKPYYKDSRVIGLAEVMDAGRVISANEKMLRKIEDAESEQKNVDGHAPGLSGQGLCAYIAAGVRTDHECSAAEEAFEKLRLGQWIMIREGTAAKNMEALLPLCQAPYYQRTLFVTDDRHPEDLLQDGHMDAVIRKAISLGVPAIRAIKMCTYNSALCFGLKNYGAVAPGYYADLAVIDDLEHMQIEQVYINGELVAKEGKLIPDTEAHFIHDDDINHDDVIHDDINHEDNDSFMAKIRDKYPEVWSSFHLNNITPDMFHVPELKNKIRILCLQKYQLLTMEAIEEVSDVQRENNGVDIARDIIKMAVLERHHNTGHVGLGYLRGYGLKKGAVATSVAHDAHNLIVVGTNEDDMCLAAKRCAELQGALIVVADGQILHELPLPIAGIMSEHSIEEVDEMLRFLKEDAYMLGVSKDIDPFMTLSFASLPVIPKLRLNGKGLIDVVKNEIVEITLE